MGGCDHCRDDRGGRRYVDRVTYICTGEVLAGMYPGHHPVYDPCGRQFVDERELAVVRAEDRRRRLHAELVETTRSTSGLLTSCRCGTTAIRVCGRCHAAICNDDERCCAWETDTGRWICRSCSVRAAEERRVARAAEAAGERARYAALPRPTAADVAKYMDGDVLAIVDGRTHRVDGLSCRDLTEALLLRLGSGARGAAWRAHDGDTMILDADSSLYRVSAAHGHEVHVGDADDRLALGDLPRSTAVTPLAEYRSEKRRETAERHADRRRRGRTQTRSRELRSFARLIRPLLIVTPVLLLLMGALAGFRAGTTLPEWTHVQVILALLLLPTTALVVVAGGFLLTDLVEEGALLGITMISVVVAVLPVVTGALYGGVLVGEIPPLQDLAESSLGDRLLVLHTALVSGTSG